MNSLEKLNRTVSGLPLVSHQFLWCRGMCLVEALHKSLPVIVTFESDQNACWMQCMLGSHCIGMYIITHTATAAHLLTHEWAVVADRISLKIVMFETSDSSGNLYDYSSNFHSKCFCWHTYTSTVDIWIDDVTLHLHTVLNLAPDHS